MQSPAETPAFADRLMRPPKRDMLFNSSVRVRVSALATGFTGLATERERYFTHIRHA
jgi:hypothetical protein